MIVIGVDRKKKERKRGGTRTASENEREEQVERFHEAKNLATCENEEAYG